MTSNPTQGGSKPGQKPYDAHSAWPTTVEQAGIIEPIDPAAVATAEREAREAVALVDALEKRVVDGDESVQPDEIEQARSLGRFAKLRAAATAQKAAKAKHAAWLRACGEIRAEIEAYAPGVGTKMAAKLQAAEQAIAEVIAAAHDHNTRVRAWRQRMVDLGNLEHTNPLVPPATQAHIGYQGNKVIVRRRRIDRVDPMDWVTKMVRRIRLEPPGGSDKRLKVAHSGGNPDRLYDDIRRLDAMEPDPDPNLRFFRSRSGQVIVLDDTALAGLPKVGSPSIGGNQQLGQNQFQRQILAGDLVEISREEAWGE